MMETGTRTHRRVRMPTTAPDEDKDKDNDDRDKARGQWGRVSPSPAFCMGRVFFFLFVFN